MNDTSWARREWCIHGIPHAWHPHPRYNAYICRHCGLYSYAESPCVRCGAQVGAEFAAFCPNCLKEMSSPETANIIYALPPVSSMNRWSAVENDRLEAAREAEGLKGG